MTRDEAIIIYRKRLTTSHDSAAKSIDTLVDLGILKLDKPQTPDDKAMEILNGHLDKLEGNHLLNITGFDILMWLKNSGLQVMEMK